MATSGSYNHAQFLTLINEGKEIKPILCYTERELSTLFDKIVLGLRKDDDWQARISALELISGAARGDGPAFESFTQLLRHCHDLIEIQLVDLRSVVSKEACRTIAILSQRLGSKIQPIFELWLPKLLKQAALKINVISTAADNCIRIFITSQPSGASKFIHVLHETITSSKVPIIRRYSVEYACLLSALWPIEFITKHLSLLKTFVLSGITDADPLARRGGRNLFWILREKDNFIGPIFETMYQDVEPTLQRHLLNERQRPSDDLLSLLNLSSISSGNEIQSGASTLSSSPTNEVKTTNLFLPVLSHANDLQSIRSLPPLSSFQPTSTPVLITTPSSRAVSAPRCRTNLGSSFRLHGGSGHNKSLSAPNNCPTSPHDSNSHNSSGTITNNSLCTAAPVFISSTTHSHQPTHTIMGLNRPLCTPSYSQTPVNLPNNQHLPTPSTHSQSLNSTHHYTHSSSHVSPASIVSQLPCRPPLIGSTGQHSKFSRRASLGGPALRFVSKDFKSMSNTNMLETNSYNVNSVNIVDTTSKDKDYSVTHSERTGVCDCNNSSYSTSPLTVINDENKPDMNNLVQPNRLVQSLQTSTHDKDNILLNPPLASISKSKPSPRLFSVCIDCEPAGYSTVHSSPSSDQPSGHSTVNMAPSSCDLTDYSTLHTAPPTDPLTVHRTVNTATPPGQVAGRSTQITLSTLPVTELALPTAHPSSTSTRRVPMGPPTLTDYPKRALLAPPSRLSISTPHPHMKTSLFQQYKQLDLTSQSSESPRSLTTVASDYSANGTTISEGNTTHGTHSASGKSLNSINTINSTSSANTTHSSAIRQPSPHTSQYPPQLTTLESIRALSQDSFWSQRLSALEICRHTLLKHALKPTPPSVVPSATLSSTAPNTGLITIPALMDIATSRLDDAHHRVATEAFLLLDSCVTEGTTRAEPKLGSSLIAVFHRLGDRRQGIRDAASAVLNSVRHSIAPNTVLSSLSPHMLEIHERMKSAMLQFISSIAPLCGQYFNQPQFTFAFLTRLTQLMNSCAGNKAASSLSSSGQKLIELVYQCAPQVVCVQVGMLPVAGQCVLKRMLEKRVPDIDARVTSASRIEWANRDNKFKSVTVSAMHSKIPSTAASLQSAAPLLTSLLPTSPSHSLPSTHTDTHTQHTHHSLTEDTSVISADNSYTIKTTLPAIPTCSQLQQSISPPHTNTVTHSTPKPSTPSSYLGHTLDSSSAHPHTPTAAESRDVSWLLQNLRPHTPRDQRHEAALLLQHWAKHADAAFWISNNAQIVSALLEAFVSPFERNNSTTTTSSPSSSSSSVQLSPSASMPLAEYTRCRTPLIRLCNSVTGYSPLLGTLNDITNNKSKGIKSVETESVFNSHFHEADDSTKIPAFNYSSDMQLHWIESLHISCKLLLYLILRRPDELKRFIELATIRIIPASLNVPMALAGYCEQVLTELAAIDAKKIIHLLLPYVTPAMSLLKQSLTHPSNMPSTSILDPAAYTQQLLLIAHVVTHAMKRLVSATALELLPHITTEFIPFLSCAVIELRQTAVQLMVECYQCVGDLLMSHLSDLTSTQMRLLTIFIERHQRNATVES